jgi:hypothetical protein
VALCTERFTSSGLVALPAPICPPSRAPSMKPLASVSTSSGSRMPLLSGSMPIASTTRSCSAA